MRCNQFVTVCGVRLALAIAGMAGATGCVVSSASAEVADTSGAQPATATTAPADTPKPPPCSAPQYREFDFWLGTWRVTSGGQYAGDNVIAAVEQGCALLELWTGAKGGTGRSMNFYNAARDEWRQVWVSPGAVIDIAGGIRDGAMHLVGVIDYSTGDRIPFRGTWTPLPDGAVRQHFEEQRDGQWQTWFDGRYEKSPPQ